ncbi:hypothetical protein Sjap_016803 [Stephania japonica]|uniref:LOB domain-containing protein n=1 Tax=Stephania japonica TaxID=461633 RepID=A0AAP0NIN3_9MAGN
MKMPSCGLCKLDHAKCTEQCEFRPFFYPDDIDSEAVYEMMKNQYIKKLIASFDNKEQKLKCIVSLKMDARTRRENPLDGNQGVISSLNQKILDLKTYIASLDEMIVELESEKNAAVELTDKLKMEKADLELAQSLDKIKIKSLESKLSELKVSLGDSLRGNDNRPSDGKV